MNNTAKSSSSSSSSSSNTLQPELPVYLASFWREAKVDIEQAKTDLKQLFTIKMQLKKRIEAAALGNGGAGDDDIECGDQEVNFSCPLSLCRITHPARGKNCKHFQCFDLEVNTSRE